MLRTKTQKTALYGIISAIIIIMSFTPLGFLKIPALALEITFLPIPVAIGAAMLGPSGGLVFGLLFGIMSFLQCFGLSVTGTELLAINPYFTAILCIVPRALMGFCSGLVFKAVSKIDKAKNLSFAVSSFSAAFFNTVFFLFGFAVMFGNGDFAERFGDSLYQILATLVSVNGILEIAVCTIIGFAVSKSLSYFFFGRNEK